MRKLDKWYYDTETQSFVSIDELKECFSESDELEYGFYSYIDNCLSKNGVLETLDNMLDEWKKSVALAITYNCDEDIKTYTDLIADAINKKNK